MLLYPEFMKLASYIGKVARRSPGELAAEAAKRLRTASQLERRLGGRAFRPYAVSFWLTRRCNLNCGMCWVAASKRLEGDAYVRGGDELSLAELRAVVDNIARWRPRIGITGGEPFLRRDAPDFIAHVKARRLRCGVNTNGTFLEGDAARLVALGLDSVMVSIDGPPDVHDRIRRSPGSFARARASLAALLAERKRRGARAPYVKVTCTVSGANVDVLAATPGEFADLPLDEFTFQHLWFTDQRVADAQRALFGRLFDQDTTYLQGFVAADVPPLDAAAVAAQRAEVIARRFPFPVNFYPPLADADEALFYRDATTVLRRPCFSRWLRLDVLPDGTATPCLGFAAGNVREKPLTAIWNGSRYRRFRLELAARRRFPGCERCCGLFSD